MEFDLFTKSPSRQLIVRLADPSLISTKPDRAPGVESVLSSILYGSIQKTDASTGDRVISGSNSPDAK